MFSLSLLSEFDTMATREQLPLSKSGVYLDDLYIEEKSKYDELKKRCGDILTIFLLEETVPTPSDFTEVYGPFRSLILEALEEKHSDWLVFVPGEDSDALNALVLEAIGDGFSVPFEKYQENCDRNEIIYSCDFPGEGIEEKIFAKEFGNSKRTEINIPFGEFIFNIALNTDTRSYIYGFDEAVDTSIEVETSWKKKGDTSVVEREIAKLEEELQEATNACKSVSENLVGLKDPDDVLRQATELGLRVNQVKEIAGRLKLAKEKREAISGASK